MNNQSNENVREAELINVTELLNDYLKIFWRMRNWVVIFVVLGAVIFYGRARLSYEPVYTASATFTINMQEEQQGADSNSSVVFFDNATAEQMAKTFPYILTSSVLRRKVQEDLGGAAASNIQANVTENTNLFTISVTDSDPGRAYATLQSVIKNYPEISEVIVGKTKMTMLDETGVPPYPDNPKSFKEDTVKGMLLGFFLVMAWAAFLVVTRKTIRKEADIQKYMNTSCLGTVPQVMFKRRSVSVDTKLLLTEEKMEDILQEPFRIIRNKMEHHARKYKHKVFLVTSAVAGEGKSTVAINMALSLAQAGHKVALVDCDLRNPSDAEIFGLEEKDGLTEILEKKVDINQCFLTAKELNLDNDMKIVFLPGGTSVADGSQLLGRARMGQIIESLRVQADYIILDSAPAGLLTDAVVLAQYADAAVFVVRKDVARVNHIMEGMEHLAESKVQIIGGIINGA